MTHTVNHSWHEREMVFAVYHSRFSSATEVFTPTVTRREAESDPGRVSLLQVARDLKIDEWHET